MYVAYIESYRKTPLGVAFYRVRVADGRSSWIVERRFSEFACLREALAVHHGDAQVPRLPSKSILSYFGSDSFLNERCINLSKFIAQVLSQLEPDPQSVTLRTFLGIFRPCCSLIISEPSSESEQLIPSDAIVNILSFMTSENVVRLGLISRVWHRAAMNPSHWSSISLRSVKFETMQKGFLRFLARPGIAQRIQHLRLRVQFSTELSHNLSLSLPGDIHFSDLRTLQLDSISAIPIGSKSSSRTLFQELLEAVFADNAPLAVLEIRTQFTLESLKTILGIAKLCPLRKLRLNFIGDPVALSESDFLTICEICFSVSNSIEKFHLETEYPQSWSRNHQLFPDSVFGERIGHYDGQRQLCEFLSLTSSFLKLRELAFPFTSCSEVLLSENLRFPCNLQVLKLRFVVDGITFRRQIDRSNRSIITDVFSALPSGLRVLHICTIGLDESRLLDQDMMPYVIPQQSINFDIVSDTWLADWRSKLACLESLVIDGPCTGLSELLSYLIRSSKLDTFLSLFPKLKILKCINCVSAINEDTALKLVAISPFLETVNLIGQNEKLTDSYLFRIAERVPRISSLRTLVVPKTRYMSYVGMEAIRGLTCVSICDVEFCSGRSLND